MHHVKWLQSVQKVKRYLSLIFLLKMAILHIGFNIMRP